MGNKISVILPVMFGEPWQEDLARFQILTMRAKTKLPFELVIVETESELLGDLADKHMLCPIRDSYTADFNAGLNVSTGDFKVHIGIDVLVGEGWLEAMLECFTKFKDCGISTISVGEPGVNIGPNGIHPSFDEAMYGPLMMFRKGWFLDPLFPNQASDNDLVMRIYQSGKRSYRNNSARAFHMNGITWTTSYTPDMRKEAAEKAYKNFRERYGDSPLAMYRMMIRGENKYGREYL